MKKSNAAFFLIFGLFWSALVLVFDGFIVNNSAHQIQADYFPGTPGTVTHSEVTRHRGSKGKTYGVDIRYTYQVNGQAYESGRYRYGMGSSSDSDWAFAAVGSHPVGSHTTVFYDPGNPGQALLVPGIDGGDFMLAVFLTPFNAVMAGFWAAGINRLRQKLSPRVAGSVPIFSENGRTRVRLPRIGPGWLALATTGGAGFLAIFGLGFAAKGFHPSRAAAQLTWMIVLGAGAVVYLWQWFRIRSGDYDLVIDEGARRIDLPRTFGRKERRTVGFPEVSAVTTQVIEHRGSKGGTSFSYAPTLQLRGGQSDSARLADWYDEDRATSFAAWLREELQVPDAPPPSADEGWEPRMPASPGT